jgi:amidohydrolase
MEAGSEDSPVKLDTLQEKIIAAIDEASNQVLDISHQIHDHPELGNQEFFASGLLVQTLKEYGFEVELGYAKLETAFCARKGKPHTKPVIAFLAEYDALPEIGHACGHNLICTSALSAGIGLGSVMDELQGQVWVIGTPAEETAGAKVSMAEGGYFKDIDGALMIHPHIGNYYTTHALALTALKVEFFGKPSHAAAAPWEGVNALDAMLLTFNNINALRQQLKPDVRIHGVISKGGVAPNIIPEYTEGHFYVRAQQRVYLNEVLNKFYACCEAAAQATGCRVDYSKYEEDFDEMVNNLTLAERVRDYLVQNLGSGPFAYAPDHFGSIDMGNVSHVVPGIHVLIDIANGQSMSPHTRPFCDAAATAYAGQAMLRAGKALALTGYDFITQSDFRQQARSEFEQH